MGRPRNILSANDARRFSVWAAIIKNLIADRRVQAAKVASAASISPSSLSAFLRGEGGITLPQLERALEFLGHELDAVSVEAEAPFIRKRYRPVATCCNEGIS